MITAEDLPSVNAVLNASSALLVTFGYGAVRRGRVAAHKFCMLTAVVLSALFLASYLYFHLVVRNGEPTHFTGADWVRPVYYAILLSHTVLAALAAPLVVTTAYLGLRDRLRVHVWLARWTMPIWLYVSITGVIVYVMLYHLYPTAARSLQ